jgi:hypothetical protein
VLTRERSDKKELKKENIWKGKEMTRAWDEMKRK